MAQQKRTFYRDFKIFEESCGFRGCVLEGKDKDSLYRHRKNESELRQLHETIFMMKLLDDGLIPDCQNCTPGKDYLYTWERLHVHFSAGGATSRTSKVTEEHLDEEMPAL
jgi:hypothetical protein